MTVTDPYKEGLFKKNPYAKKQDIKGKLVVILDGKIEGRNLNLITPISRVINKNEIHELIITDETGAAPGKKVDNIAYLGFFQVEEGSVILEGDEVFLDGTKIGHIAGFDETHMPNHLNIIILASKRQTGLELKAELGMEIICKGPRE